MSSIMSRFVAGRAAAKPQQRQQIGNVADTVSRADFDRLRDTVTTMAQAVEGLIEDFDAVTSPEKLKAVVNAAFKGLPASAARAPLALPATGNPLSQYKAPADDATDMQVNKGSKRSQPLALPADDRTNIHLAPQGD